MDYTDVAVCNQPHRYENSHVVWDHTQLPLGRQRLYPRLYPSQPKPLLDLATEEAYNAELT